MGRPPPDIHCHIKDLPDKRPDQLALPSRILIVKAAQHPAGGTGVVVLNKSRGKSCVSEIPSVETFHEKAALVIKYARFHDDNTGQRSLGDSNQAVVPKSAHNGNRKDN